MSEEKKDTIEIPVGKYLGSLRNNPWIAATFVFAILSIALAIAIFSGTPVTGNVVNDNDAGDKLVSFINSQQGEGYAKFVSSEREGQLYKVTVDLQGQEMPIYVTLDGKYALQQLIPLEGGSSASAGTQTKVDAREIELSGSPVTGKEDAPVTIVLFSDFSCPYCGAASGMTEEMVQYMKSRDASWEPAVPGILEDYVKTGKAKLVFKYFPGHGSGQAAHLVGLCLNEQSSSLFWKFHDKAFAAQDDTGNLDKMKDAAKSVGANMAKLQTCLDSDKYESQLESEYSQGREAGVSGTPAFFVNEQQVSGAVSYTDLKQTIEAELAKTQ